jgi:hypothetical protein
MLKRSLRVVMNFARSARTWSFCPYLTIGCFTNRIEKSTSSIFRMVG